MAQYIHRIKYFYNNLRIALNGAETNFTSGSIRRAIFLLSVPMILEMVMESLFAVVDIFFVGKVSTTAVATVGLTESVLTIIYSVAIGLSMATTALVARRVGEKNHHKAGDAAFQAIALAVIISLVIGVVGAIFARDILRLMGGEPQLVEDGFLYTRIMFLSNTSIMLLFLINGIFRGAGNASLAMRSLWLANGLNIVLDPIFIFGLGAIPAFGVAGAAIATTTGRTIGVLFQLYHLLNGKTIVRIGWENIVIRAKTLLNLLRLASESISQFLVESASWIFLVRIISLFGSEALAGYTIAIRIIIFSILPSWGLSNAAATLVGQNLGAGHPLRAEKSVWKTAYYNFLFLTVLSLIFYFGAYQFVGIFSDDPDVIQTGVESLRTICLGYVFLSYGMVLAQSFNGAGDTRTPLLINIGCYWLVQIPLAYGMAVWLDMGPRGVYIAIAIAFSLAAVVSVILFQKGKWKLVKV
ncbi:MATE family efflux transporter [Tunicatimonas pelagia]|uniref:MATE family efflux transporter n=1 Tax=Tunicatimonas pelagia TaxID=931531 RepID=UPI002666F7B8|nr:MATE family efflux transporter [Tunicatimonas pelagia]WKN42627.1 MATE family efflux transporter [Tunicatimonas pelagia]